MDERIGFQQIFAMRKIKIGAVLRQGRHVKKLKLKDVALAVGGVTAQAVGQWERDENWPGSERLAQLCGFLELDLEAATKGLFRPKASGALPSSDLPPSNVSVIEGVRSPEEGPRDVPVYGVTVGGSDGHFDLNGQIVEYARRPPHLKGSAIFALYVNNDSMEPRYDEGDIIYLYRSRPASPGDYVVVELKAGGPGDAAKAYLKRLTRRTAKTVFCDQLNPKKTIEYPAAQVARIFKVLSPNELAGA